MSYRSSADKSKGTERISEPDILVDSKAMAEKNFLFYGDNLAVLRKNIKDETVDLCYIDPPFNSQRDFNQIYNKIEADVAQAQAFIDTWSWDDIAIGGYDELISNPHGRFSPQTVDLIKGLRAVIGEDSLLAYIISLTLRSTEIHRALKCTGTFYLHCDPTASHYLKLMLDCVFGPESFRNEIIWLRATPRGHAFTRFASSHDVIFCYSKESSATTWNEEAALAAYDLDNLDEKTAGKYYQKDANGRLFRYTSLINPNPNRPNLEYEFLGVTRVWRWTRERMEAAYKAGEVVQTKPGTVPQYKRYLDEQKGKPISDVWTDISAINSQAKERLGYPTQKPLALLERIIKANTNEGDVVLDAYCGCGTTIDAAQQLKRKWIGIDITYQSISVVLRRLEKTYGKEFVVGIVLNGIPKDMKSAVALANKKDDRLRKEFEKWAVLTYTSNRAVINDKKGADGGIDGTAFFRVGAKDNAKVIFQVKSGGVQRKDIATLRGDMEKMGAALSVLITLEEPTKPMIADAKAAGQFKHEEMGRSYDRIIIVTIKEIVEDGKRLDIPMSLEVLKAAEKVINEKQESLF